MHLLLRLQCWWHGICQMQQLLEDCTKEIERLTQQLAEYPEVLKRPPLHAAEKLAIQQVGEIGELTLKCESLEAKVEAQAATLHSIRTALAYLIEYIDTTDELKAVFTIKDAPVMKQAKSALASRPPDAPICRLTEEERQFAEQYFREKWLAPDAGKENA